MELIVSRRTMALDDLGAGPPVVLLHAFPFDRRSWARVAPLVAPRARLLLPDLRGFGSSAASAPYSIAELADDIAGLLDVLSIGRAAVGGISMGGYVALAFAAHHPERLAQLILIDTKAAPDTPEAAQARNDAITLVRAHGVDAYLDRQLPKLLSAHADEALRAEAKELGRQTPGAVIAGIEALRDRPDRRPELPAVAVPTLVVVGELDAVTPPGEARAMATAIPGAELVEIPRSGHLPNLEAPEALGAALAGFLR